MPREVRIVCALKIRAYILCVLCATLLILSFPKFNLWILPWFGFVPLFVALQGKSKLKAFLFSYLTGIIFWLGIIYWLIHVTLAGMIILVLYLALWFGLFGLIITRFSLLNTRYSLLFIPCLWVLFEYLRSHLFTGFGWALLGYSQYLNLPIIQIANITGAWGVSFLLMMVNVLIYRVISYKLWVMGKKGKSPLYTIHYLSAALLLFLCLSYGFYKLQRTPLLKARTPIKISVIQPNIPQAIKWERAAREKILKEYQRLSRLAAVDKPDLIIWPEAALPGVLGEDKNLKKNLKTLISNIQIPFLVGAVIPNRDNYSNRAILISKQGEFIQSYDKLHLVPFGEYIPFKRIFAFLETVVPIGNFTPGKEYTVFSLDYQSSSTPRFGVLICFEDLFPGLSRQFINSGAHFLVNITNDAWFGDTSSPQQHLQASVFRAVENSVYLVRAANTGISGFITPTGRAYPLIDNDSGRQTFVSGYKTEEIFLSRKQNNLYTQWGDWFVLLCGVILICGIFRVCRKNFSLLF